MYLKPNGTFCDFFGGRMETTMDLQEFRMKVHLFGAKSSPSCVNFALQKIAKDTTDCSDKARNVILENFYVDDLLRSLDDEDEFVREALEVKEICNKVGFQLTKYKTTSKKLLEALPEKDVTKQDLQVNFEKKDATIPTEKTLGIAWRMNSDQFCIEASTKDKPLTRRGLLSTIGSVFDPIGIVSPFVLQGKLILQELCKLDFQWDENIPEHLANKWEKWLQSLDAVQNVTIQRSIKPSDVEGKVVYQLHHFSDASTTVYATVSYIREIDIRGHTFNSFLFGKTRVAPIKTITIPRLELTAATLMVCVDKMIKKSLINIEFSKTLF